MTNDIARRAFELGQSTGKASKQHDRGRVDHFRRIFSQWRATLTAEEKEVAQKAFNAGYEDEAFDETQYAARSL